MINKNFYRKTNDKKILHKVGKQWKVVSVALLMAIGGGAAVATHANAQSNNNTASNDEMNVAENDYAKHVQGPVNVAPKSASAQSASAKSASAVSYLPTNGGSAASYHAKAYSANASVKRNGYLVNSYVKSLNAKFPTTFKPANASLASATNAARNDRAAANRYSATAKNSNNSAIVSSLASSFGMTTSAFMDNVQNDTSSYANIVSGKSNMNSALALTNNLLDNAFNGNYDANATNASVEDVIANVNAHAAKNTSETASDAYVDAVNASASNSIAYGNNLALSYAESGAMAVARANSGMDASLVNSMASTGSDSTNWNSSEVSASVSSLANRLATASYKAGKLTTLSDFTGQTITLNDHKVGENTFSDSSATPAIDATPAKLTGPTIELSSATSTGYSKVSGVTGTNNHISVTVSVSASGNKYNVSLVHASVTSATTPTYWSVASDNNSEFTEVASIGDNSNGGNTFVSLSNSSNLAADNYSSSKAAIASSAAGTSLATLLSDTAVMANNSAFTSSLDSAMSSEQAALNSASANIASASANSASASNAYNSATSAENVANANSNVTSAVSNFAKNNSSNTVFAFVSDVATNANAANSAAADVLDHTNSSSLNNDLSTVLSADGIDSTVLTSAHSLASDAMSADSSMMSSASNVASANGETTSFNNNAGSLSASYLNSAVSDVQSTTNSAYNSAVSASNSYAKKTDANVTLASYFASSYSTKANSEASVASSDASALSSLYANKAGFSYVAASNALKSAKYAVGNDTALANRFANYALNDTPMFITVTKNGLLHKDIDYGSANDKKLAKVNKGSQYQVNSIGIANNGAVRFNITVDGQTGYFTDAAGYVEPTYALAFPDNHESVKALKTVRMYKDMARTQYAGKNFSAGDTLNNVTAVSTGDRLGGYTVFENLDNGLFFTSNVKCVSELKNNKANHRANGHQVQTSPIQYWN